MYDHSYEAHHGDDDETEPKFKIMAGATIELGRLGYELQDTLSA